MPDILWLQQGDASLRSLQAADARRGGTRVPQHSQQRGTSCTERPAMLSVRRADPEGCVQLRVDDLA